MSPLFDQKACQVALKLHELTVSATGLDGFLDGGYVDRHIGCSVRCEQSFFWCTGGGAVKSIHEVLSLVEAANCVQPSERSSRDTWTRSRSTKMSGESGKMSGGTEQIR